MTNSGAVGDGSRQPGAAVAPARGRDAEADVLLQEIADYTLGARIERGEAWETARHCLLDALGCGLLALGYPACSRLIGPVVPGAILKGGARVPGTAYELDPVQAAFCIGAMVRWLDFNDTWLAAEWGHPSDNLGAILAVADYAARHASAAGREGGTVRRVLEAMIKAYEVQGVLALNHAFNRVGLDHVLLVRVASTAVATWLLGGTRQELLNALSNAFIDGGALRTYRHAPNNGSRKSWAAGDATSRAVRLALLARQGEMGYPTALTAPTWGFQDVLFRGRPLTLAQPLGSYVMEHVLFKISFPAEFHAQTAVEAAIALHPQVKDRLDQVEAVRIETQESAVRIIDKTGPLKNPADRDHCLQYMVAVGLLKGTLTAEDYEDAAAADPRIDWLRGRMIVTEEPRFTADYLDPTKRSIGNSVQVIFRGASPRRRSPWNTRSVTGGDGPRGSRSSWPSSRRTSARASGPARWTASWKPAPGKTGSSRCRWPNPSACSCPRAGLPEPVVAGAQPDERPEAYEALYDAGVAAVFGPGTVIGAAAAGAWRILEKFRARPDGLP